MYATSPVIHPACAALLGPQLVVGGPILEVQRSMESFYDSYQQEKLEELSVSQRLKRGLIHLFTKNSTDSALSLLSPETHAESLIIQSAIQKGEAAEDNLKAEFVKAKESVRAKINRLAGESPDSISNRLKRLPLEYKRTLLREKAIRSKLNFLKGKNVDPNEKFEIEMHEIEGNKLVEKKESFTLTEMELNLNSYKNRKRSIEAQRDRLFKEQAQLAQELTKLQDLIRNCVATTDSLVEADPLLKDALSLASDIKAAVTKNVVIHEDETQVFTLGKPTVAAGHSLRNERTNTAFRSLLNQRTRIVQVHKNVEARIEALKEAYERVVAVNPKLANDLQLKFKLEAAKFANTMGVRVLKGGSIAATTITPLVLGVFKGFVSDEKGEDIKNVDEKLNAEEKRCKTLIKNKKEFEKCLSNYLQILQSKYAAVNNETALVLYGANDADSLFSREKELFLDEMILYAKDQLKVGAEIDSSVADAVAELEIATKNFYKDAEEMVKVVSEEQSKDTK